MSDVFLSYASEDRERAGRLANAFGHMGWSVWWDRKIIAGQAFDQAIERELETARSVVVLWSANSIESEWVKNEAAAASERGVLVPALIDSVKLPLEFRRKQTADLVGWKGDEHHAGFQGLCQGVAHAMGAAAPPVRTVNRPPTPPPTMRWTVPVVTAFLLALGLGVYVAGPWRSVPASPSAEAVVAPKSPPPPVEPGPVVVAPSVSVAPVPVEVSAAPAAESLELAVLVVGTYQGDVIADSKGPSRKNVAVTLTRVGPGTVHVSSAYPRLDGLDIHLSRNGNQIYSADGDTPFIVDLDRSPPSLILDPRSELAYRGTRRP